MAMILSLSWTVLTGPDSGIAFILAAEDVMLSNVKRQAPTAILNFGNQES